MERIIKGSTALGKKLIDRGSNYDGYSLRDIYTSYSAQKQQAYDWCFEKFRRALNSSDFSIISHSIQQFSVSWLFDYVDPETGEIESAMQIETANNSYTILLNK